ncbi:hypothetical protein MP228_007503 [Amoeboaphelidium protococcarum]|nr:hypothetical protein MP228_007503 [Amoeboaphelidium protococcarum]
MMKLESDYISVESDLKNSRASSPVNVMAAAASVTAVVAEEVVSAEFANSLLSSSSMIVQDLVDSDCDKKTATQQKYPQSDFGAGGVCSEDFFLVSNQSCRSEFGFPLVLPMPPKCVPNFCSEVDEGVNKDQNVSSSLPEFVDGVSPPSCNKTSQMRAASDLFEDSFSRGCEDNGLVDVDHDDDADNTHCDDATDTSPAELSDSTSSGCIDYGFCWSVATQKGYKYPGSSGYGAGKVDIHADMEDCHFPSSSENPNFVHEISGRPFQLFMVADGHGGANCARHAVKLMPQLIISLVNSRVWNFYDLDHQKQFRECVQQLFLDVDKSYCDKKLEEYRQWILACGGDLSQSPSLKPPYRTKRPNDDGCTLIVNLLYNGFLVNCNVGDSRTLMLQKQAQSLGDCDEDLFDSSAYWKECFASRDHTPSQLEKAIKIYENGGRFIYAGRDQCVANAILDSIDFQETHVGMLEGCRIARAPGWKIDELNFPACTTLNLAGTMGDLFFKYEPALLDCKPDVSFVQLKPNQNKYLMVMASDGLWDHLSHQDPAIQHSMLSKFVEDTMEHADPDCFKLINGESLVDHQSDTNAYHEGEDGSAASHQMDVDQSIDERHRAEDKLRYSKEIQRKLQKVCILAHGLADREMVSCSSQLYARGYVRYDDVTVFVVLIEGVDESTDAQKLS